MQKKRIKFIIALPVRYFYNLNQMKWEIGDAGFAMKMPGHRQCQLCRVRAGSRLEQLASGGTVSPRAIVQASLTAVKVAAHIVDL